MENAFRLAYGCKSLVLRIITVICEQRKSQQSSAKHAEAPVQESISSPRFYPCAQRNRGLFKSIIYVTSSYWVETKEYVTRSIASLTTPYYGVQGHSLVLFGGCNSLPNLPRADSCHGQLLNEDPNTCKEVWCLSRVAWSQTVPAKDTSMVVGTVAWAFELDKRLAVVVKGQLNDIDVSPSYYVEGILRGFFVYISLGKLESLDCCAMAIFLWRCHIPKFKITHLFEVLVSSDIKSSKNLTSYCFCSTEYIV